MKKSNLILLIMWAALGIFTIVIGPTRITYACLLFSYLADLLAKTIEDIYA